MSSPAPLAPTPQLSRQRQRGAALLTAMVIVTLVTTVAASMVWQQWRSVQVESAERSLVQSQWMLVGALDYGRMILRADKPEVDHLGEPWALGLAETRVSSLLSGDKENTDDAPDAFLSGQLIDATARYNLYNLLANAPPREIQPEQLAAFKRLCQFAGVQTSVADALAQSLRRAVLAFDAQNDAGAMGELGGTDGRSSAPLIPRSLDQLVWLGIDAGTIERLRPFTTVLPLEVSPTPINVNTASREVLAAVIPNLDLGRAERLVQVRQRDSFGNLDEVKNQSGLQELPGTGLALNSEYFEVQGRLRLEDRVLSQHYLVHRVGKDVMVIQEEKASAVQILPEGAP
jgi:general secretion pathway protein K